MRPCRLSPPHRGSGAEFVCTRHACLHTDGVAASALNCPMCGASVKSTDAASCQHCGTQLATVSCPSCFGRVFKGARFCSHCGARADRKEASITEHRCPRCRLHLRAVQVGSALLQECSRCQGIWADAGSLEKICDEADNRSALLGQAESLPAEGTPLEKNIRYVPCPVCQKLMNRVNFARCSQVVVDVCKKHGTWFDRDELRRIVEFIQSGGLANARAREVAELEEKRRRALAADSVGTWDNGTRPSGLLPELELGISATARLLRDFLRG